MESISFNEASKNNSNIFHNISEQKVPKAQSKNTPSKPKKHPRNVVQMNTHEVEELKIKCEKLENRCLSLAMENKLLRSRLTKDEGKKVESLNQELKKEKEKDKENKDYLNQSSWQPTMNDISEIALISGLSIDRARQAFTTIIEDSTEFRRRNSIDENDPDIVNRIDFLMNELNRLMDGVENPHRHNEFNSQASINFSKISEPKYTSISQDNIRIKKRSSNISDKRMSKSFDKN